MDKVKIYVISNVMVYLDLSMEGLTISLLIYKNWNTDSMKKSRKITLWNWTNSKQNI